MHETNMRFVLFAPLLYNRSTLAPKWQQWMRELKLIIPVDDMASLERKKEGFFMLDELDKVLEYMNTKLRFMKTDDYNRMTRLLVEVEKVDKLELVMELAKSDSYFVSFYDNLKTRKKMKDSQVSCLMALVTIKQYLQYVKATVIHDKDLSSTLMKSTERDEMDMNSFKDRGNDLFHEKQFRDAHEMYTKALAIGVFNHILYSNRCLTALHMKDFWDALWDARRAITIKPDWQKGHYHYAQAFFELKDIDRALHENQRGQKLCNDGRSQTGDLQRQATMFNDEKKRLVSLNSKKNEVPDLVSNLKTDSDSDSDRNGKSRNPSKLPDINSNLEKSKQDWTKKKAEEAREEKEKKAKKAAEKKQRELEERERRPQEELELRRIKRHKVEALKKMEIERRKAENAVRKRKEAEKQTRLKREKKERHAKEKEKRAKRESDIARQQKEQMRRENERLTKERNAIEKCLVDGSLALVSGQSRQAITQYDRAAELLKATNKEHYGMHEADYMVFLYAQATAYLKSGIPLEINKALSMFENITKNFPNMLNGLPFYGLATSLFKLNRFSEALGAIKKSLSITTRFDQTTYTWPGTSTNIEETEKGKLKAALKELQRCCKIPLCTDATCRYMKCTTKREMYISDLDFKGYIKVQCSEGCHIDYHVNCWKAIKTESNILGEKCLTPDCLGTLSNIEVIGADGIVRTELKVKKQPKPSKHGAKKKSAPKPKGKKFRKSSKAEKSQGDTEGQCGHGQTAEGAQPATENAWSKSALGATKPMTGLDAGIAVATDSIQNDASRNQMVKEAEGNAEIKPKTTYLRKRDRFDDVEQLHKEASNIAQFDVGPNRRHLDGERMNRGRQPTSTFLDDGPFAIPVYAARKMDASIQKKSVLNPNAAPFIPSAKKSSPSVGPARNNYNPLAQAQQIQRAQTPMVVFQGEATIQQAAMSGNGFNHHKQSNAIPPSMQHAQHQMQMWQQQGAVPRYPHQLPLHQQQQMLARQQYTEPQVAPPKNSFEWQRQRERAGNDSQRMQNRGFTNLQPKRSSYHNGPTSPQLAWLTMGHIQGLNWHKELVDREEEEEEDPCVICYDEMSGDNTLEIECGHIFHRHCLHEWLKQQQTCPTCRNFTILKDDYPSLHK